MREIIGQLHNELFIPDAAGHLVPTAQVILLYREQHYAVRGEGALIETPLNRDFAFCADAAALRRMSADFAKVADSLDARALACGPSAAVADEEGHAI